MESGKGVGVWGGGSTEQIRENEMKEKMGGRGEV